MNKMKIKIKSRYITCYNHYSDPYMSGSDDFIFKDIKAKKVRCCQGCYWWNYRSKHCKKHNLNRFRFFAQQFINNQKLPF